MYGPMFRVIDFAVLRYLNDGGASNEESGRYFYTTADTFVNPTCPPASDHAFVPY